MTKVKYFMVILISMILPGELSTIIYNGTIACVVISFIIFKTSIMKEREMATICAQRSAYTKPRIFYRVTNLCSQKTIELKKREKTGLKETASFIIT